VPQGIGSTGTSVPRLPVLLTPSVACHPSKKKTRLKVQVMFGMGIPAFKIKLFHQQVFMEYATC
jgi:hypothetical protein